MQHNPHVVVVTETWLRTEIADSEIVPPGYGIIRKDRDTRGGGVAIIFKEGIDVVRLKECPETESIWCKLKLNGICCVLGAVYRPQMPL